MRAQEKAPPGCNRRGEATCRKQPAQSIAIPPIEKLLPRLEQVKKTAPGKWTALCPAHADKRPSLSIRETDDGTLLVKCWSGCGAADVVEAIGLRLHDLFPRSNENRRPLRPGERWVPRDAMAGVSFEALVVAIAGEAVARGEGLDRSALDRVAQAAGRLRAAAAEVGCG